MATIYTLYGTGGNEQLPRYEAGAEIDAGRWQVVPHRVWTSTQSRVHGVRLAPGQQALAVEVELNNRSAFSTREYQQTLNPAWPVDVAPSPPEVVSLRDSKSRPLLHPGMPERVAYVWVLPDTVALPAALSVDVVAKSYKRVDNLYGTPGWFNPKVIGRFTLPVEVSVTGAGAPVTKAPVAPVPVSDTAVSEIPVSDMLASDIPVSDIPVSDIPVPDMRVPDMPVPDMPVPDMPVADMPVADMPVADMRVPATPERWS